MSLTYLEQIFCDDCEFTEDEIIKFLNANGYENLIDHYKEYITYRDDWHKEEYFYYCDEHNRSKKYGIMYYDCPECVHYFNKLLDYCFSHCLFIKRKVASLPYHICNVDDMDTLLYYVRKLNTVGIGYMGRQELLAKLFCNRTKSARN